ncbi:fibronectin type III domain-containing protein [Candidatus Daviesbacteria bacterium]|nr:fibronectin type III domain-containing protein [Candidatus Daviesbacteria bacterium]
MKIPTLLGLALLTVAVVLGIIIFFYKQKVQKELELILMPKKIQVANITESSATITWQTYTPALESVVYGVDTNLDQAQNDDRNQNNQELRLTHFVTLKNLQPDKTYYFKIQGPQFLYPNQPLSFKTGKEITADTTLTPLRGSVVDQSLNPVDEALVFLKITGAAELAGFTTTAGNFIIPLKGLYKQDLAGQFTPELMQEVILTVSRANLESSAVIILPPVNHSLPPIILGENQDLRHEIAASTAPIATISAQLKKFDLNNDGQLNALDVSIMIDNISKKQKLKQADVNGDRKIDQKDLDLLEKALQSL